MRKSGIPHPPVNRTGLSSHTATTAASEPPLSHTKLGSQFHSPATERGGGEKSFPSDWKKAQWLTNSYP